MSRKVVVTGGAGFVGSNLVEALVMRGDDVYSIDNYFTGKKENHIDGATYIDGETSHINSLISFKPDILYHLGEYPRVEQSFDDWDKVWNYNVSGTARVVEFCRDNDVKIIYAGSSTKFGDEGLARDETPYAWTKAVNTELVRNFNKWYGLKYAVTYFYNVYGPREIEDGRYATVVAKFLKRHRDGEKILVHAPGTQVRYFTHVDDIVNGLLLVGDKGEGDNFGLGSPRGYSIVELAELITGKKPEIGEEVRGNRIDSPVNISRSIELGWKPTKNLENYIKSKL